VYPARDPRSTTLEPEDEDDEVELEEVLLEASAMCTLVRNEQ
jgi:hypothetical protein